MLDLRRLSLLVAVARLGSISAAAADAGCTASSASEQLSKLERELATPLLERAPRSVRLTTAGRELAERGRALLAQAEAAERAVEEIAGLAGGRVRVAAYQTGAVRFVIPAIASFTQAHPQVRVVFEEREPEDGLAAVGDGIVDIALVNSYLGADVPESTGIEVFELGRDPFVLVTSTRFAVAGEAVSLSDYADVPWVSGRPEHGFQAVLERASFRTGFTPDVIARVDSYDLMLDIVAEGLGVAIVPRSAVHPRDKVRIHELNQAFDLDRREFLISRAADQSPATRELRTVIARRFEQAANNKQARARRT